MSTPRSLTIPDKVRPDRMETTRGAFAALVAEPEPTTEAIPVLLLPGWTGSKEDFLAVLGPMSATGRRVVAIDHRGQYESPGPEDIAAYTLEAFGADAVAIADTLGAGPVHLVGHSFGGLVARAAVLTDPTVFASITLLASGPARLTGHKAAQLRVMAAALPVIGLAAVYAAKRQVERANGVARPVSAEIETFLRHRFCSGVPVSLEAMTRHLTDAPDRVAELSATGIPIQVVTGADDDGWPLDEQAAMAHQLGARYVELYGAVHSPAVEAPEATTEVLASFWAEIENG